MQLVFHKVYNAISVLIQKQVILFKSLFRLVADPRGAYLSVFPSTQPGLVQDLIVGLHVFTTLVLPNPVFRVESTVGPHWTSKYLNSNWY